MSAWWGIWWTLALLLLSACGTNERKARQWAYANRDASAAWCADLFPVREAKVVQGKTIVLPGDTVVATDTVKVQVDCPDGTEAECPPTVIRTKTITDTLLRTDTVRVRDRAMESAMAAQRDAMARRIEKTEAELGRATESSGKWRGRFIIAAAAAALLLWRLVAGK